MPAKLDRCVEKVKQQQMKKFDDEKKAKNIAYAICSKSTGYVKTSAHTWEKRKIEESLDIYSFGLCFKDLRTSIGKSAAWKKCSDKTEFRQLEKPITGEVYKDKKLQESIENKISQLLLEAGVPPQSVLDRNVARSAVVGTGLGALGTLGAAGAVGLVGQVPLTGVASLMLGGAVGNAIGKYGAKAYQNLKYNKVGYTLEEKKKKKRKG